MVTLLHTTQIIADVCFILLTMLLTPALIKTKIVWIGTELFPSFFYPGWMRLMFYVRAWALGCFYSHISTQTVRRALAPYARKLTKVISEYRLNWNSYSGRIPYFNSVFWTRGDSRNSYSDTLYLDNGILSYRACVWRWRALPSWKFCAKQWRLMRRDPEKRNGLWTKYTCCSRSY